MAFIPLPLGLKAELKFLKNGQLIVNIYHFTADDVIAHGNLSVLAAILKDAWVTHMRPLSVDDLTLEEIVITDVSAAVAPQLVYTTGLPSAGTSASDDLPSNVAVVISNRSDVIGRSQRGRTYIAGMPSTQITGNTVASALQTGYIAYHNEIAVEARLNSFSFGVASKVTNGAPRVTAQFTEFTSFTVENVVDSQRRRLPGRGA